MQLIVTLLYYGLAILMIVQFRKFKNKFSQNEKATISALIALLIIIPLPIIDLHYSSRLNAFLFIPIILLLLFFGAHLSARIKKVFTFILGTITLLSLGILLLTKPHIDVSKEALKDLENIKTVISNPKKTVIVSRHNLEFWVAWTLNVNVSQEGKFDDKLIGEYDEVLILNQIKGRQPQRDKQ